MYHLSFEFPHTDSTLTLEFGSSLFEGKGTADESWGLDNVAVGVAVPAGTTGAAAIDGGGRSWAALGRVHWRR